jgi:hypothetical protein
LVQISSQLLAALVPIGDVGIYHGAALFGLIRFIVAVSLFRAVVWSEQCGLGTSAFQQLMHHSKLGA